MDNKNSDIGFIVLRHVESAKTNMYWQICYDSIRTHYPDNMIVIIDDASDYMHVTQKNMTNTIIIQSEYPKRGELLPYYYYAKNKWFDTAVIIHDSVFINKKIDFSVEKFKLLWDFSHHWDLSRRETEFINSLTDNGALHTFHKNKRSWNGCFGCMSVVKHEYLEFIDKKHTLTNLLEHVTTRYDRMAFERVIGCILQKYHKLSKPSILGNIHRYCLWGYTFDSYLRDKKRNKIKLPVIKVWTGR